MTFKMKENAV